MEGARQVRQALPEATQVFIAPPSARPCASGLLTRGTDGPEVIRARLREAEEELTAQDEFQHVIVNDDLERASAELIDLVATIWGSPNREADP